MKEGLFFFVFFVFSNIVYAQSKFKIGSVYSVGYSNILITNNTDDHPINNEMSMKTSIGTGIKSEYFFSDNWGLFFQSGFQQRGTVFKTYQDEYKPRYRLSYWDIMLGAAYQTKLFFEKYNLDLITGISQHTLLEADRVYDTGKDNIINNFEKVDVGLILGIGGNIHTSEKDVFQISIHANAGLLPIFSDNPAMNNSIGRNFITVIQICYLLGR